MGKLIRLLREIMELMISMVLLIGAAILGAWRLEHDFDRETARTARELADRDKIQRRNRI